MTRAHINFALLVGSALALSGCYSTTGDFGRPQAGYTQDVLLPFSGAVAAKWRDEPSSLYAFTEDEKELRNRAWVFLNVEEKAPRMSWWEHHGAFHRLMPPRESDVTLFHRTQMGGPELGNWVGDSPVVRRAMNPGHAFRSLTSRYNFVRDRITQDHALVPYFKLIAAQVQQADHVRLSALGHVGNVTGEQASEAKARVCENALIMARVNWAFFDHAAQYRYSLEHLLIEGPERESIPAERTLMAFEADIGRFTRDTVIPADCLQEARMPPPLAPRPLVRKG
jgi:hypothetical protein